LGKWEIGKRRRANNNNGAAAGFFVVVQRVLRRSIIDEWHTERGQQQPYFDNGMPAGGSC
jgi:hypothetical protein